MHIGRISDDDFIKKIELNAQTAKTPLNVLCKNIDKKQFMKAIEDHITFALNLVIDKKFNNASKRDDFTLSNKYNRLKSTVSSVILPTIFVS
jgi:hypothetical protein